MGKAGIGPIRLEPVYKKAIWAGARLKKIRGLQEDGIGICREVCAYKGSENRVEEGQFKGCRIDQVIADYRRELMGPDDSGQLVRVAYMDTREDLSIQVHPNEEQAERIGDFEKSESWYILEADPGAYITAGVNCTDKATLRNAAESGDMEQYLVRIPVKAGDFAMIPAGLVHACGKDMLALEVGSFGGITYRLYDYGRGRPLDLDKGMEILDPSLRCELVHTQEKVPGVPRPLVRHRLFSADVLDVEGVWTLDGYEGYRILCCVEGACRIIWDGEEYPLPYTKTLLIPAGCGPVEIRGNARLLMAWKV